MSVASTNVGHHSTDFKLKKNFRPAHQTYNVFSKQMLSRTVHLPIVNIGNNLKETLIQTIANKIEGKCQIEGYIKPGTCNIITYSSGNIKSDMVSFNIVFDCMVCIPVEGMMMSCIAKNITKAGIRAEINEVPSPVVIFIARDHHHTNKQFSKIKENDTIIVKVIGQRFELNDTFVSVIAELVDDVSTKKKIKVIIS